MTELIEIREEVSGDLKRTELEEEIVSDIFVTIVAVGSVGGFECSRQAGADTGEKTHQQSQSRSESHRLDGSHGEEVVLCDVGPAFGVTTKQGVYDKSFSPRQRRVTAMKWQEL